jgi:hypothetical protein
VIGKAGICMMTTHFPDGLRARPMEARAERKTDAIWFLTDRRGLKDDEIEACPQVCLTFFHAPEKVYLSLTGDASVCRDPERAHALWNKNKRPGGKAPTTPISLFFVSTSSARRCGTARRTPRSPLTSSPRRG